ncbi:MAG: DUF3524 domain-containing protein [Desulfurivibrio sp.]|nr:DUF3524 domain-containing protein [Desulfurivibrio sp.]
MSDSQILALESYHGGSHRRFLDDLRRHLAPGCHFELLSLPARGWKWRMRLAALFFARQLTAATEAGRIRPGGRILCSSLLDVAALRGLLPAAWQRVPICLYFHENQFAYPVRHASHRDLQFALTNYTAALAADRVAFNSAHNRETLLWGCRKLLKRAPDMKELVGGVEEIAAKSEVLPPGLELAAVDQAAPEQPEPVTTDTANQPPVILWNHRWEYDKQPELFFAALRQLAADNFPFRLIMAGEGGNARDELFTRARRDLAPWIRHWGYAPRRQDYLRLLHQADVVVSTAAHEFFGLAVLEAVRAGCRPLLPARLAYPEIYPARYLYGDDSKLVSALKAACRAGRLEPAEARRLTAAYDWPRLVPDYQRWLGCLSPGNGD